MRVLHLFYLGVQLVGLYLTLNLRPLALDMKRFFPGLTRVAPVYIDVTVVPKTRRAAKDWLSSQRN